MKKATLPFLIVAFCAITACGNHTDDSKKEADSTNHAKFDSTSIQGDTKFAVAAADGGMLEVELGKLAQTNGASQQVKDFGQQMITDHGKAAEELKTLAASKNITLPSTLSNKNQDAYNNMAKKKGKDFDKAYASFMVDDHKDDIDEFKKEADKGNDADIQNWAAGKIPVLQHHLMMAQAADSAARKK